jgi:hypothetical protein
MKTHLTPANLAMLAILTGSLALADEPAEHLSTTDLTVAFKAIGPTRGEDWDSAAGFEAQIRFWSERSRALAFVVGGQMWKAPEEYSEWDDNGTAYTSWIAGDATILPVGLSVFLRRTLSPGLDITLEGGARYVFVDSSLDVDVTTRNQDGIGGYTESIDIADTFLGVLGVNIEADFGNGLGLLLGAGYQFDFGQPHQKFMDDDLGATSFAGGAVSAGLIWIF